MADKHPYANSIGGLSKAIEHFRNAFPPTVNADTLKKLGFASKNESYVINAFRFLGFIDENDQKTREAATTFSHHDDHAFAKAFSESLSRWCEERSYCQYAGAPHVAPAGSCWLAPSSRR